MTATLAGMKTLVVAVAGAFLGGALGLYGPVLIARVLSLGSGSYEEFLVVWLISVPSGFLAGGWGGARLMRRRAVAASR